MSDRSGFEPLADPIDTPDELGLMRMQTRHLQRIRGYLAFIVIVIIVNSIAVGFWLAGIIETSTKAASTNPFG